MTQREYNRALVDLLANAPDESLHTRVVDYLNDVSHTMTQDEYNDALVRILSNAPGTPMADRLRYLNQVARYMSQSEYDAAIDRVRYPY